MSLTGNNRLHLQQDSSHSTINTYNWISITAALKLIHLSHLFYEMTDNYHKHEYFRFLTEGFFFLGCLIATYR